MGDTEYINTHTYIEYKYIHSVSPINNYTCTIFLYQLNGHGFIISSYTLYNKNGYFIVNFTEW